MKQRSGMPYDVVAFSTDERALLMTLEEEGAFHRLLRHAWINGSVPDDLASLAQICRCPDETMVKMWARLQEFWRLDGRTKRRTNQKQESERKYLKSKAEAGSKGGSTSQANRKQTSSRTSESASSKTQAPSPPLPNPSIPKEEKQTPKPPLPRDAAMDEFTENHRKNFGTEYPITGGDATQLASLRKVNGVKTRASPDGWTDAVVNYFASPLDRYTLADLSRRFGVFKNSRLDRFGKPVNHLNAGGRDGTTKTERNRQAGEELLRALADSQNSSGSSS